ncbi:MAG TPA: hypothetical protein VHZ26_08440 [Caulobacteraceae bacterium]|jgi:hypothetical protein|nr:hypothetical protein [Caulobacteraceae bacterium]
MLSQLLKFYSAWMVRAFSGTFRKVEEVAAGVGLLALFADFLISPSQRSERLIMVDVPAIVCMGALILTVAAGLIVAPFEIYWREQRRRIELEQRLSPKLEFSLPETGTVGIETRGHTLETFGGSRQTIVRGLEPDVVCIQCKNVGEGVAHRLQARLMGASRYIDDDQEVRLAIVEPLDLSWKKEAPIDTFSVDLAPGVTRRIWIGGIRSHGHFWIYRDIKELPLEYQRVFGGPGRYHLLIQVDGDDTAAVQVSLEVEASAGPQLQNGLWRGNANVRLLESAPATR